MRALKTIGILSLSPVFQCSACRTAPLFTQQDFRPQCLAAHLASGQGLGLHKRISSSSPHWHSSSKPVSSSGFSYRIGASFSAKGRRFNPKEDIYTFDPEQRLSSEKDVNTGRPNSGQDAFFVSRVGNSSDVAFGVADGVGGWAESGIDSAHFSHGLCQHMAHIARDKLLPGKKHLRPRPLLQNAYNEIVREGKINGGGSTACVAVGDQDGNVQVAK